MAVITSASGIHCLSILLALRMGLLQHCDYKINVFPNISHESGTNYIFTAKYS
jgi:hypothetical protein